MVYPLTVGTKLESMAGKSGIVWAMDGNAPVMLFYIASIDEFASVDADKSFKFAVKKVDNILFVCVKCGDTKWYSAPLNPYLAEDYEYDLYNKDEGKPAQLYVLNAMTGVIERTGEFFIPTDFIKQLEDKMKELDKEEFDVNTYRANVKKAYETYKTDEELAKTADFTCEI